MVSAMVPTSTTTSKFPRSSLKVRSSATESMCAERLPRLGLIGRRPQPMLLHKKSPSSRPIPLPRTHIPRTSSELQLSEDMALAEWREMCMFQRLVAGMKERQETSTKSPSSSARTKIEDSRDSYVRSTKHHGAPIVVPAPKMVTPQESPSAYADTVSRPAQLADLLRRASDISDLSGIKTRPDTTKHTRKQQPQQHVNNDWSVEGFVGMTIESTDEDDNDDEIFSMDI